MQFIIAITLLLTFSAAYLLHQFWSRELLDDGFVSDEDAPGERDQDETLRAA